MGEAIPLISLRRHLFTGVPSVPHRARAAWASSTLAANRLPGAGVPMIQLNMKVGSAKTVKKGMPELRSAGLITDTAAGEPTLTDKGYNTSV